MFGQDELEALEESLSALEGARFRPEQPALRSLVAVRVHDDDNGWTWSRSVAGATGTHLPVHVVINLYKLRDIVCCITYIHINMRCCL